MQIRLAAGDGTVHVGRITGELSFVLAYQLWIDFCHFKSTANAAEDVTKFLVLTKQQSRIQTHQVVSDFLSFKWRGDGLGDNSMRN